MEEKLTQRICVQLLVLVVGLSFGMNVQAQGRSYVLRTCDQYSSSTLQEKASEYQSLIDSVSSQYGVNPNLIKAVITAETCFRPHAVSHRGASGLMQLMPATARRFGARDSSISNNLHAGTRYLRWLLDRYGGSVHHAVAAYNSGEGTVDRHGANVPFMETRRYVVQVMNAYKKLGGKGGQAIFTPTPADEEDTALTSERAANDEAAVDDAEPIIGRRLVASVAERRLTPKAKEKRLLPSCMSASRKLHKATSHRDKKGERTFYYIVKEGDSIDRIMRATGSSAIMIKRYNDLDRSLIKPGQKLKVSECRLD